MINYFKNVQSPSVSKEMDIYEALDMIQNPDDKTRNKINQAREVYSPTNKDEYNKIKTTLPCFTFNFQFNGYKKTENIIAPTGFIYLDVDDKTDIDLENNPYIFASWKSVSGKGRGILVQVENLTVENFKLNYKLIADELEIKVDLKAAKPTQFCIHSYDEGLYFNDNSIIWICKEGEKKYPKHLYPIRKDSNEMGRKKGIRFNTITDYDFKGEPYIYFEDEKELSSIVNIPKRIKEGGRNSILYGIAYQIKALNPEIDYNDLSRIVHYTNKKRCMPSLGTKEVEIIINKVDKLVEPEPMLNKEIRFVFNPDFKLSRKEKSQIMNPLLGEKKSKKTIQEIKDCLNNWDIMKCGKVTQESLVKITGKNIKTIQKYYRLFDDKILAINKMLKLNKKKVA